MRGTSFLILFLFSILSVSCSSPSRVGNLDLEAWRNDRGGCKGEREHLEKDLEAIRNELLGKNSNEIGRMFGAPDIHQLGARNLKVYVYFLESGPHCEDKKLVSQARKAVFRFNAVSLLSEINFQREMPE
jgi:hypothetical protein